MLENHMEAEEDLLEAMKRNRADVDLALWMLAKERVRVEELRRKLAELEADIERRQSEEASVCPEDVGIVEYVGALKQRLAALEAALDSARRSK